MTLFEFLNMQSDERLFGYTVAFLIVSFWFFQTVSYVVEKIFKKKKKK